MACSIYSLKNISWEPAMCQAVCWAQRHKGARMRWHLSCISLSYLGGSATQRPVPCKVSLGEPLERTFIKMSGFGKPKWFTISSLTKADLFYLDWTDYFYWKTTRIFNYNSPSSGYHLLVIYLKTTTTNKNPWNVMTIFNNSFYVLRVYNICFKPLM